MSDSTPFSDSHTVDSTLNTASTAEIMAVPDHGAQASGATPTSAFDAIPAGDGPTESHRSEPQPSDVSSAEHQKAPAEVVLERAAGEAAQEQGQPEPQNQAETPIAEPVNAETAPVQTPSAEVAARSDTVDSHDKASNLEPTSSLAGVDDARESKLSEMEHAVAEMRGAEQLARDTVKVSETTMENYSLTDAASNMVFLTELQDIKDSAVVAPPGASHEFVDAAEKFTSLLNQMPDPAAAAEANQSVQKPLEMGTPKAEKVAESEVDESQRGRRDAAASAVDKAAKGLLKAYGPKAQDAVDSFKALSAHLKGDDPSIRNMAAAYRQASHSMGRLVGTLALDAVTSLGRDREAAPALDKLAEHAEKSMDRWEQAAAGGDTAMSGDKLALETMTAQQMEGASAGDLANATGGLPSSADGIADTTTAQPTLDNLRDALGAAANGLTDAQLTETMGKDFAETVEAMGITKEDVQAAMTELKAEAVSEGRDPALIDEAVAIASLVERETVLDKEADHSANQGAPGAREDAPETSEQVAAENSSQRDDLAEPSERAPDQEMSEAQREEFDSDPEMTLQRG